VEGHAWIETLPPNLAPQASLLHRFLDAVEADDRFRALEVGCSFARGTADELSDVDVGLWVADDGWTHVLATCDTLLRSLGGPVDSIEIEESWGHWFFVQYHDGVQLDVAAQRVSTAKGRMPDAVILLDRDGVLAQGYEPDSYHASKRSRRAWTFRAWFSLGNVAKYLDRGSLWEALDSLERARNDLLRIHAAKLEVPYPGFGVTSIFDVRGADVPPGFGDTFALAEPDDVRRAACALASLLEGYGTPPLATWTRSRLA